MKIKIEIASDWEYEEIREVENLDCLRELCEEFNDTRFIVEFIPLHRDKIDAIITIYDDYVE